MKGLLLTILTIIMLNGCVSNSSKTDIEPLWFSDSYSYLSEDEYFVFKANDTTFELAELKIFSKAEHFSKYIKPHKFKEFSTPSGSVYLLYGIKKKDIINILNSEITKIYNDYLSVISNADSSRDLLKKYSLYNDSTLLLDEIEDIVKFASIYNLSVEDLSAKDRSYIEEKLDYAKSELVFNVSVKGDLEGQVYNSIIAELNRLGFSASEDGYIFLNGDLTLKDVDLDNNYVNKFWALSLTIKSIGDDIGNSITFNGRESQINKEALDQTIVVSINSKIKENLNKLLP